MDMEALVGVWRLTEVDVDQSEAAEEEYGESLLDGDDWPKEASLTDYAGGSLELSADGTYATRLPDANWAQSSGTWTLDDDGLNLVEDCSNGFDGIDYVSTRDGCIHIAFQLVPDSHDGLDLLVLTFSR